MTRHQTETATFGAGCFWGVQAAFDKLDGVISSTVGYSGGHTTDPTYKAVCTGETNHAEVVTLTFNPTVITYAELLNTFFAIHNPTTRNRQGPDVGTQYRSVIFTHSDTQMSAAKQAIDTLTQSEQYSSPIVTEVLPEAPFYPAEDYHQKYIEKNGGGCQL